MAPEVQVILAVQVVQVVPAVLPTLEALTVQVILEVQIVQEAQAQVILELQVDRVILGLQMDPMNQAVQETTEDTDGEEGDGGTEGDFSIIL